MSCREHIQKLVDQKRLLHVTPPPGARAVRTVFLREGLYTRMSLAVIGRGRTKNEEQLYAATLAVLHSFIKGHVVTLGMDPNNKDTTALLAKTLPTKLGIMDFRCRDPEPGMRLLGGFAEADCFIGIHCFQRNLLVGGNFSRAVRMTVRDWNDHFDNLYQPLASDQPEEYVSNNVLSV